MEEKWIREREVERKGENKPEKQKSTTAKKL